MKKMAKIFSVVMAVVMMLSVAIVPVSAKGPSDAKVSFGLEFAPVRGEKDVNGVTSEAANIYKLTLKLTSDVRLTSIIMDIDFDPTIMVPLDSNGGSPLDYTYTTDAGEYKSNYYKWVGELLDDGSYKSDGKTPGTGRDAKLFGPSNSKVKASYRFDTEHKDANSLLLNYKPVDKSMEIGECVDAPIMEMYFVVTDPSRVEGAVFGFGNGVGASSKSVGFDNTPQAGKYFGSKTTNSINIMPLSIIGTPEYVYTAAPAVPTLTKTAGQVKMDIISKTPAKVADAFQFRVVSSISSADWDTYFANTGKEAASKNAITELGFVAYKGAKSGFNMDLAKQIAKGETTNASYDKATTDYIQHTAGADAKFGARIDFSSKDTRTDVTYIAYAKYLDNTGAEQYVFYGDSYEALLNSNFTTIEQNYVAKFGK